MTTIQEGLTKDANVVLLTLDGVRYQEFFDKKIFTRYWNSYASKGIVIGDPDQKSKVKVSNLMVLSLPGYRSMHLGSRSFCYSNNCGNVKRQTVGEKVLEQLSLASEKVAIISSWSMVCKAGMQKESKLFNSCGDRPVESNGHEEINTQQAGDHPTKWSGRFDKYTFAHGIKYLEQKKPRFMHLSLLDSDEHAHDDNWKGYLNSLKAYDLYIDRLFKKLLELGEYGKRTTVIITTDHGRGKGKKWTGHTLSPAAAKIFMAFHGPDIPNKGSVSHKKKITHLHLRPLIELILGLKKIKGRHRLSDLVFE